MEASAPAGGFVNTGEQERSIPFERRPKYTCEKGDENTNHSERSRAAGGQGGGTQLPCANLCKFHSYAAKRVGIPARVPSAGISGGAFLAFRPDMRPVLPLSPQ